jgi:F-type H+-transporting ATPase subunit gamma
MSDSVTSLRHKIASADELESVVRTMKTMAASSIGQYENAILSLDDYFQAVQLGLAACFRQDKSPVNANRVLHGTKGATGAIVFGSDQGLVGQFNDVLVEFALETLGNLPGEKMLWTVGERVQSRFADTKLQPVASFILPNSIGAITRLVGQILIEIESQLEKGVIEDVYLLHNRPESGAVYTPMSQQLFPLDQAWRDNLSSIQWPTKNLPEVMNNKESTLRALVREYLFITLFRACAESLASENASRLASMQRAEKNINELQDNLKMTFHRRRQSAIDEELFDLISGFDALSSS